MFEQEKKYFSNGINADDAPFVVDKGDLINAVNHRFGSSEDGAIGYNESVPGNINIPSSLLSLFGGIPLGSAMDDVSNRLLLFYYGQQISNANGNIICVELSTGTVRLVLNDSQVRDGGLGFDPAFRINDAYVIDGKLYWSNNFSQPGSLNIDAAIKFNNSGYSTTERAYTRPDQNTIRLIKKTQNLPVQVRKVRSADVPSLTGYTLNNLTDAYQFFVRYIYRNYERTVIGPYSKLAEYNYKESPLNAIEITFDTAEDIHEDVQIIQLGVRYNNIGAGFIIKQWDKDNVADALAITNHNTTGVPLRYYFLNNESGPAVDVVDLNKPFDSVPLKSKSPALARNRLFLANNLFGYTAPTLTSLTITPTVFPSSGGIMGTWFTYVVNWNLTPGTRHPSMPAMFVDLGVGAAKRYVFFADITKDYVVGYSNDIGTPTPGYVPPASISNSLITLQTNNLADIDVLVQKLYRNLTGNYSSLTHTTPVTTGRSVLITNNLTQGQSRTFKSGSAVKAGIVFLDEDRRKCGVVTKDSLKANFPYRSFSQISFTNVMSWALSNTNALTEIPSWAHYYSIVRTKNLTTDFFIQGHVIDASYVTKDEDGVYQYDHSVIGPGGFDPTVVGIGLWIKDMFNYGIGYTFSEGDLIDLYFPARVPLIGAQVIGQDADWIIIERLAIGALVEATQIIFDLYTPHKASINEGFYEVGEIFAIDNPETVNRAYSKLTGTLNGDVYAIARARTGDDGFTYVAEAMSPNDKYWKNWWTDAGWINIVDNIGQQRRPNSIAWSNVRIPGTKSNGLSSFDALDVKDTPQESGELNKIILASKVQEEGSVMLGICKQDTYSLYLGETQVTESGGTVAYTATSTGIIGTMNRLKGGYGTVHPESVKEFRGNVFWFDLINAKVIQYGSNGLMPVSDYKLSKYFKKFSRRYIETNNNYPMIGGIDPSSELYLLSTLGFETVGYLPNLPTLSVPNGFELYDGLSMTLGFKMGMQRFISTYPFYYQLICNTGVEMYTFMRGRLFKHSETLVPDNFFDDQQYTTKLMFVANAKPNKPKVYTNIAIEANMAPVSAVFYSTDPYEQITDLVASDFKEKEGVWYANLWRDRLSPNVTGTAVEKMYKGDKIRSSALKVQLEFATNVKKLQLKFVNIGYHESKGHST